MVEIKRISSRVDAIQRQFNGWTTKKRVDGKVRKKKAVEMRKMFEQLEKASIELSNIDSELRLELVRLMEAKGGLINNNYAEVQEENPELCKLLEWKDKLGRAINEIIEPIDNHHMKRAGIDRLVNEFVEEIKNTVIDIAENCSNDHLQEVKDLNELTSELERWQQDIANDYCVCNRDSSLLFEKRNGVYIREVLGISFNRTLSRLGRHKKDTYYNMVEPLKEKRNAILQYMNGLREKKHPVNSTEANKPPKKDGHGNGGKTVYRKRGTPETTELKIEPIHDQVFICYSHKDKRWLDDLQDHLKPYVRNGSVTSWSDKQIAPGSKWFSEIKRALACTKVAVLLVTPKFLASDFIHEHELTPLLKEAEKGDVRIIWIPVIACSYKETPLKDYEAAIDPEKPLANMRASRDETWVEICKEIKKAVSL